MARHNREGSGEDQLGFAYQISYQPDWLMRITVTRRLPGGRQSTKILFKNTSFPAERALESSVRTGIRSLEQGIELEVTVRPGQGVPRRLQIEWQGTAEVDPEMNRVTFTIEVLAARRRQTP